MTDPAPGGPIGRLLRFSLLGGLVVCLGLLALSWGFKAPGAPIDLGDAVLGGLNVATFVFLGQAAPYGSTTRPQRLVDALIFGLALFTIQFAGTVAKVVITLNDRPLSLLPLAAGVCLLMAGIWFLVMPVVRNRAQRREAAP